MTQVERDKLANIEQGLRQMRDFVLRGHRREQIAKALLISAGEIRRLREAKPLGA